VRRTDAIRLLLIVLFALELATAQSTNGTISGIIFDPSGKAIPGAQISIVNDATGISYPGATNSEGIYVVPDLPPGNYRIQVSNRGFKTIIKPDILVHVQDALAINFTLPIGAASEIVTVQGGAPLVNTESASVGTVIDRDFVESLPLNGRSFNTLLQLTPGVVIAPAVGSASGQFSIAGQRASSNNFLVDGVSANFGVAPTQGQGTAGTGSAQAFSALGGTSSLVSVEALQEFRVETSSFAPEFGRSPGGQVILNTRSGTNDFQGGVYEYFRNDVMDANNWFNDWAIPSLPKAPERHNDFGGFLGGPFQTDKTFFFVSYEGARLRQPSTELIQVPSEYARTEAPIDLVPFLSAFPLPDNKTITPGVYSAGSTGSFSNPGTLDAGSVRLDHTFSTRFSIFGRYNQAPSDTGQRTGSLSDFKTTAVNTKTITIGANLLLGAHSSDSLRANYSVQDAGLADSLDSFGGATPPSLSVLAPNFPNPQSVELSFFLFDSSYYFSGPNARNRAGQPNFVDDFTLARGTHQLKFGADYRAIYLDFRPAQSSLIYEAFTTANFISTSSVDVLVGVSQNPTNLLAKSTSLYAQDTWKLSPRFTATYGFRWELAPAPSPRNGSKLAAWENADNPALLALAPFGTPLWATTYTNFAPRVGAAYRLSEKGDFVLRAGAGIFYDLASDTVPQIGEGFASQASKLSYSVQVPLSSGLPFIPTVSLEPPYPNMTVGFSPNLKLPRSYQWNVALEKSFGGQQAASVTYVGQAGRDLLRQSAIDQPNSSFLGDFLLTENDARSNYNALQIQYRKPLASRVETILNYTWSHSLDSASNDVIAALSGQTISSANDYASSDFDVRHSFSGALLFAIPGIKDGVSGHLSKGWSVDTVIVARSGFPYNASFYSTGPFGGPGPRPDLNPGIPFYLSGAQCAATFQALGTLQPGQGCPGGKALDPNLFSSTPPSGRQGTEGRNDIPGFGLTQVDLSLGRQFQITDQLKLQFRADAFNLLNHPNFQNPIPDPAASAASYVSSSTLNQGLGGLNALFQEGGPRSLQLSLKLTF
jgi:hypothetical protein